MPRRRGWDNGRGQARSGRLPGGWRWLREILTVVTDDRPPVPRQGSGAEARSRGADAGASGAAGLPGPGQDIDAEWSRAVRALGGATEVCLACHIRPDADALGSMLAVAHALCARGASGRGGAAGLVMGSAWFLECLW